MIQFSSQGAQAVHPNVKLIEALFTVLHDAKPSSVAVCYAVDASFKDIAFWLDGRDSIRQIWRFVRNREVKVSFDLISADDRGGNGHWIASYTFTETVRKIVNDIMSTFIFRDDLILNHLDRCRAMAVQAYPFPKNIAAGLIGPLRRRKTHQKLDGIHTR
jgi:hypothetical protein